MDPPYFFASFASWRFKGVLDLHRVTMLTGGARSGKSRRALELAGARSGKKAFVATATVTDEEMRERIEKHRAARGAEFLTVEAPVDLAGAIRGLPAEVEVAVVDCLTVWMGNLFHERGENGEFPEVAELLAVLEAPPCDLVVVTNELGMGVVPDNAMARRFRDLAGRVNQEVAARAGRVELLVGGLPLVLKDNRP
jgi:adenosylcobinamide kinase/adenosylcobinamide-phosphate guanylyltransferase